MGLVNIPLSFICGLGKEMIHELKSMGACWHRNFDPEKQKLVLDRMMKKYHCDVLLVTPVYFVEPVYMNVLLVQSL